MFSQVQRGVYESHREIMSLHIDVSEKQHEVEKHAVVWKEHEGVYRVIMSWSEILNVCCDIPGGGVVSSYQQVRRRTRGSETKDLQICKIDCSAKLKDLKDEVWALIRRHQATDHVLTNKQRRVNLQNQCCVIVDLLMVLLWPSGWCRRALPGRRQSGQGRQEKYTHMMFVN